MDDLSTENKNFPERKQLIDDIMGEFGADRASRGESAFDLPYFGDEHRYDSYGPDTLVSPFAKPKEETASPFDIEEYRSAFDSVSTSKWEDDHLTVPAHEGLSKTRRSITGDDFVEIPVVIRKNVELDMEPSFEMTAPHFDAGDEEAEEPDPGTTAEKPTVLSWLSRLKGSITRPRTAEEPTPAPMPTDEPEYEPAPEPEYEYSHEPEPAYEPAAAPARGAGAVRIYEPEYDDEPVRIYGAKSEPEYEYSYEPASKNEPTPEPEYQYNYAPEPKYEAAPEYDYGYDTEPEYEATPEYDYRFDTEPEPTPEYEPEPVREYVPKHSAPADQPAADRRRAAVEPEPEEGFDLSAILSEFSGKPMSETAPVREEKKRKAETAPKREPMFEELNDYLSVAKEQSRHEEAPPPPRKKRRRDSAATVPGVTDEPPLPDYEPTPEPIYTPEPDYRKKFGYASGADDLSGLDFSPEPELPESAPRRGKGDPEIDSRFNLDGKRRNRRFVFGGKAVDASADSDYAQTPQTEMPIAHWTEEPEEQPEPEPANERKFSHRLGKKKEREELRRQLEQEEAEEKTDTEAQPATYARKVGTKKYDEDGMPYFPPTFREYVASLFASLLLWIRGTNRVATNVTMPDEEELKGRELSPAAASKYYGSFMRSQKLRLRIASGVFAILAYISLGLPVPGMLKDPCTAAAGCAAMQLTIMLLCLDTVTGGILNAVRLKPGADSLAVFSCVLTLLDALIVSLSDSAAPHLPLCALSSLSLLGVMYAAALNTRALRRAIRVPAIGKQFFTVTGELKFRDTQLTLLKSMRSARGFVHRAEEAPPDETMYVKLTPFIAAGALLLSVIVAAVHKSFSSFFFIFSAILTPAVPFTALCAFAMPFLMGTNRIFRSGAAIAGWSGVCDIGMSRNLIVTDRDLFPESCVSIESVRIFADADTEKIISYAGTMISASGACTAGAFARLMEDNKCTMRQVENFECLSGGGLRGSIEGHAVLCGSTDLMRLMNVRIPYKYTDKTTVLLAVDGVLYGIFQMQYRALPQIRKALVELMRSNRHPVFAVRDFNINPEMLHNSFDLATDGYDFPPYVERFGLTELSNENSGSIAAVICNEGLAPLTEATDIGRSIYMVTRINLLFTVLYGLLLSLVCFVRLLSKAFIPIWLPLLLMALGILPVLVVSLYVLRPRR